jgi:hypothetical protein
VPLGRLELVRSLRVGVVAAALAAGVVGVLTLGASRQAPASVPAFVHSYDHRVLHDGLEILLVQSDGQAFATLARDPSLSRPDVFDTRAEAAYRASRPLLGYAAWIGSAGRPGWVPPALAALFVIAVGATAAGLAMLLQQRTASPWFAAGLVVLPGTYASLEYFGPELLGLALVAWGLVLWKRDGPVSPVVVALFALAGMARETFLLVPFALALSSLVSRRYRAAVAMTSTAAVWMVWVVFVRIRVGAWPSDAGQGRLTRPFQGLFDALSHHATVGPEVYAAVGLVIAVYVIAFCRDDELWPVVALHAVFATMLGLYVWIDWQYFTRVLLPLYALGFVLILGRLSSGPSSASEPAATLGK